MGYHLEEHWALCEYQLDTAPYKQSWSMKWWGFAEAHLLPAVCFCRFVLYLMFLLKAELPSLSNPFSMKVLSKRVMLGTWHK